MYLIDYLDFGAIFEETKKNHLELYPTPESYKYEMEGIIDDLSFVDELYQDLLCKEKDRYEDGREYPNSYIGCDLIDLIDGNRLTIELSIGGSNATENGDDCWGYGFNFVVDLEEEIFVGYYVENYS